MSEGARAKASRDPVGEPMMRVSDYSAMVADKDREIAALTAQLQVADDIGDTFWAALKPLNLQRINVSNPGAHVTELIGALRRAKEEVSVELGVSAQRAERDRAEIAALRETVERLRAFLDFKVRAWLADDTHSGCDPRHCPHAQTQADWFEQLDALLATPTVQASGEGGR